MAHGKETPRQKMIGMMYLVLTALLALNVARSVLDAFVIVDEGLTKTTENFYSKNEMMYQAFEQAAAENPVKAGPWRDIANKVKKRSNNLVNYIQDLKKEIVYTSEGKDTPAVTEDGEINGMLIQGKDNADVPAQIMIGDNNDGKANDLKDSIVDYRKFLIGWLRDKDSGIKASIEKSLDTSDPPRVEGQHETWQIEHFEHMPLIGVVTLMSGMQADVRNAESEILKYLYSQIDAGSFKFNSLEATVIPNTSYVLKGNEYQARVFVAAFDTTQKPVIYVGKYDSTKNSDGSYDYHMIGNYDSLPVENGKGIYSIKPTQVGYHKWGGLIKLPSPSGGADIKKPFRMEYQVAAPNLVISPTKMNVFYLGVDNPVDISVPGIPADKIFPTMTNGKIRKQGGSYIVNPSRPGNAIVTVFAEIEGKRKNMGFMEFRVKIVPDPVAKVAGMKGGDINKNVLLAQNGVLADMESFDFDLTFKVTEFTVSTTQNGFVRDAKTRGNLFSSQQMEIMRNATRGQRIYIQDIKAVGPDGTTRSLSTIAFRIN
ncbi:MAG TPA: gliding motility protein GldM [Bacteroidales bacterium]|nr:gliding motility protein GldM [Bacteroidales bacterium]